MDKQSISNFRNICLVGHGDSGKTTLAELMLNKSKMINRLGSIDEGNTTLDYIDDEKVRKFSIESGIAYLDWNETEINIIDAPGYPDFCAEALSGLSVTETAVICINANSGIMVNTRKMWEYSQKLKKSKIILINKIDMENLDLEALVSKIKETFGSQCMPILHPDGSGSNSIKLYNLLNLPDDAPDNVKEKKIELMESLVETNDEIMEKYLNGDSISNEELSICMKDSLSKGIVTPILFTSSKKELGIEEFMDFVTAYAPSPADLPLPTAKDEDENALTLDPKENIPFSGQIFKTVSDPFVGKISYFRAYTGTLHEDTTVKIARTGSKAKIAKLSKVLGKDLKPVSELIAGQIGVITKVDGLHLFDSIHDPSTFVNYVVPSLPKPMVSLAVEPKSRGDEQKISSALQRLSDSDPAFSSGRDSNTNELVITAMSKLHLDIVLNRLKTKYEVEVTTKQPKIAYLETITGTAEGHYKHKKQSGGAGQYAEVYLRLEPNERGGGFEFIDKIVGGAIPRQYIPAVEKGIKEILGKGILAGCNIIDVKATVFDGTFHSVDSNELSFKLAAMKAFQDAMLKAKPVLLEPLVNMEIIVPSKFMGDITGGLNSKRGKIQGMEVLGDQQVINVLIPLAEISDFSTELRSITAGEGQYTIEFSHYDIIPSKIQAQVIARFKQVKDEE